MIYSPIPVHERSLHPIKPLGEGLYGIEPGTSVRAAETPASDGQLGVLKVSAVSWDEFRPEENKTVPKDYQPANHELVRVGDLLISRCNTVDLVGAVVLVRSLPIRLMLSDKTLRLVLNPDVYDPEFLLFALRTPVARTYIERNATGASHSMRNISQETIRSIPVPTPTSLAEQRRIAGELTSAMEAVERARRVAQEQLTMINSLPAAYLRQAFEGGS